MKDKLNAVGIVVEYNPFHNGHYYHIKKSQDLTKADVLIAVMAPNFVQRGEPAYIDKWERAKAALEHGVDIVLELPTHLTLQSAETFAKSALQILAWAQVESIVYGSESLTTPTLNNLDKQRLATGISYAKAKSSTQLQANQILGAYYEKYAIIHNIKTQRILRTNSYKSLDMSGAISSASAIREAHTKGKAYKHTTPMNLDSMPTTTLEQAYGLIQYQLLTDPNLASYLLVDEGIENLFIKLAKRWDNFEDFIEHAISKRYTRSRIQRTLCHILLKTPRNYPKMDTARILGMSLKGQQYLAQIDESRLTPSFKKHTLKDLEEKSTAVYDLINKKGTPSLSREMGPPIII